jgi:putative ABC transport system permease protein
MIKNYLLIAFRNFMRNKTFSIFNILGLSVGTSAALVIFLVVYHEFTYDTFQPGGDRIYRVVMDLKFSGIEGHSAAVPAPLGSAIENEVTGVEKTVPVFQFQGDATANVTIPAVQEDNPVVHKKQPNIVFTNQQYFDLLPHHWLSGSPQAALQAPFTVVLSESRARQYFPAMRAAAVIGKRITYNDDITVTVSGVVSDLDESSSFTATEFISLPTISKTNLQQNFMMTVWNDWMAYSQLYVKLSTGTAPAQTEAQLKSLLKKYNKDANKDANNTLAFTLQPLRDVHFNSRYGGVGQRLAHKPTLYGLLAIAAFLLLLGCINFINLTTAQATQRAKEIGIRKTMGSSKAQLILQFLGETFFITLIATLVAVALTPTLLNLFSDFVPEGVHLDLIQQPSVLIFLISLTIVVTFLSGFYPALVLSGYRPALVLKGNSPGTQGKTQRFWVRRTLTVSQFVIAQFFVIATVMVSKQISYSLHADLGFNKEAVVYFNIPRDTVTGHRKQLLADIKSLPGVAVASTGFLTPADKGAAFTRISYHNGKEELSPNTQIRWGDPDFLKVYQLKLLAGRNIEPSDSIREFLVNESFAHEIGFLHAEDALGRHVQWNGKLVPIVGIMKNFHEQSFRSVIGPVVFGGNNGSFFHIKLKQDAANASWASSIAGMQKAFKKVYPNEDFNYHFLDETIAQFYESEQRTADLLRWATGLTIFISCLGLLGLVIYTTNTRTKEVGIRKILGASVVNIVSILSKDFIVLVLVAFVIAAPVAWWASYKWLQDFAYRTTISWWVFALSGAGMLLMALVTLSIQTIKAATANPTQSLRSE